MAPATDARGRGAEAVLVSHGSPSEPEAQERVMRDLALRVAALLPGWQLRGATLAAPGAFETALAGFAAPLVYPVFMAPGWFTDTCLPGRIGARPARILPPLGLEPGLPGLIEAELAASMAAAGLRREDTALLIAAHGSPKRPESAASVRQVAAVLARRLRPRDMRLGFIEEAPFLADAGRDLGAAICVPFFAIAAGHVTADLPQALEAAGFAGPVLPPAVGYAGLPGLLAMSLAAALRQSEAA